LKPVGDNVDIVRAVFEAFSRRDMAALLDLADPEIEFRPATARVAGRTDPYRGHDGLRKYLADVARVWQELRSEPDEYRQVGDRVVATGRVYAWGVGRVIDAPAGWVWRLRDGKVVEGRVYDTRRAALEAVGLEADAEQARLRSDAVRALGREG
jgi:ketosteroid isomerase-like protein